MSISLCSTGTFSARCLYHHPTSKLRGCFGRRYLAKIDRSIINKYITHNKQKQTPNKVFQLEVMVLGRRFSSFYVLCLNLPKKSPCTKSNRVAPSTTNCGLSQSSWNMQRIYINSDKNCEPKNRVQWHDRPNFKSKTLQFIVKNCRKRLCPKCII